MLMSASPVPLFEEERLPELHVAPVAPPVAPPRALSRPPEPVLPDALGVAHLERRHVAQVVHGVGRAQRQRALWREQAMASID